MQSTKQASVRGRISQHSQQNSYSYAQQSGYIQKQRQKQSSTILHQTHQCQYYTALVKAYKSNNRKTREIQTLNRIIKNLKQDITELNNNKQKHGQQVSEFKKQIQSLRTKLAQLQLRQLQYQKQINQERLESAIRSRSRFGTFNNNSNSASKNINIHDRSRATSKMKRDHSLQYFSQCHGSRNTENQRLKQQPLNYNQNQNYNQHYNLNQCSNINNYQKNQNSSNKKYPPYYQQSNMKSFSKGLVDHQYNHHYQSQQSFFSPLSQNQNAYYANMSMNMAPNSPTNANINYNINANRGPYNMGELFMGRKARIQMDNSKYNTKSTWGKAQLLNKPSQSFALFDEKNQQFKRNFYESQMNYQNAINYLKKQNQHLKIPIFF